ncbi:hypothetical protein D3C87_1131960 [compost metagenome]
MQDTIGRAKVQTPANRAEMVDYAAVLHHHALGQTGRAGGIHHVAQASRVQAIHDRVGIAVMPPLLAVVQIDHRHIFAQLLAKRGGRQAVDEQGHGRAVAQHVF